MAARKVFVNLPVRDLEKPTDLFTSLGFEFNKQFTDDLWMDPNFTQEPRAGARHG